MSIRSSLIWRCRRGIREMDILLQRFVDKRYGDMTNKEKEIFDQLLNQPDLEIMSWIMEKSSPPTDDLALLVQSLREVSSTLNTK